MLRLSSTSAFNGRKALIQEVSEICKLIIIASSAPTSPCYLGMHCSDYAIDSHNWYGVSEKSPQKMPEGSVATPREGLLISKVNKASQGSAS